MAETYSSGEGHVKKEQLAPARRTTGTGGPNPAGGADFGQASGEASTTGRGALPPFLAHSR